MSYGDGTVRWSAGRERWIGRFEIHDGRAARHRGWVSDKTEAGAWRKLKERRQTLAALPAHDPRLRLDRYLTRWLDDMEATVRPGTAANYRSMVEHHVIPELGGFRLAELRPAHVAAFRDAQLARGYRPRTVSHRLKALRAALQAAVRAQMIDRNVAALVPGPSVPSGDKVVLAADQALRFLDSVNGDRLEAIYVLAIDLGMRQGEILGLRWSDVQAQEPGAGSSRSGVVSGLRARSVARIEVQRTLTRLNGKTFLSDTKTARSRRTLTLTRRAADALAARRLAQRAETDRGYDLVFTTLDGYALDRTTVTRDFQRKIEAAGLPKVSFHSLRHTAITRMHDLGLTMREIADIVGHAKPSMTSDTYTHLDNASAKAARLLDG